MLFYDHQETSPKSTDSAREQQEIGSREDAIFY